jgi:hypothetical protein
MYPKGGGTIECHFIISRPRVVTHFEGKYIDIKPNEFLKKCMDKFDDPNLLGEMMASVWLKKVSCGRCA